MRQSYGLHQLPRLMWGINRGRFVARHYRPIQQLRQVCLRYRCQTHRNLIDSRTARNRKSWIEGQFPPVRRHEYFLLGYNRRCINCHRLVGERRTRQC